MQTDSCLGAMSKLKIKLLMIVRSYWRQLNLTAISWVVPEKPLIKAQFQAGLCSAFQLLSTSACSFTAPWRELPPASTCVAELHAPEYALVGMFKFNCLFSFSTFEIHGGCFFLQSCFVSLQLIIMAMFP